MSVGARRGDPRADHPEMTEHDGLTSALSLTVTHGCGERPTERAKSKNLRCCPEGMYHCSGMNRKGQGLNYITINSLNKHI